jgi:hypothetical protein
VELPVGVKKKPICQRIMEDCKHEILRLLPVKNNRLRCRHCHLSITEEELGNDCCPECLSAYKIRRRDFEKIKSADNGTIRYCCEECGMVIEC